MNRDEKAAVIDEVAEQIQQSEAVLAIDYRGLSVTQAVELRTRLGEAGATFRVVKNRLTLRAADKAGADGLKALLEGPTAFAFVRGDAALAAKAVSNFRRDHGLLAFKGGTLEGETLSVEQVESIARLPGRDQLQAQFVGVLAAPVTGLVRGLGSLIQGLTLQLGAIREQGLIGDEPSSAAGNGQAAAGTGQAEAGSDQAEASADAGAEDDQATAAGGTRAQDDRAEAAGEDDQAEAAGEAGGEDEREGGEAASAEVKED